jgi:hypothetical protein
MLQLIRIVAGDEQAIADAQQATAESSEVLREASAFYLQQVLFAADANSYRVLGVNPGEGDERIREHYRWLARWLHPDRNPDQWEVIYSERVSNAWQNLRTAERRGRYDIALGDADMPDLEPEAARFARPSPVMVATSAYEAPRPGINLRWVPSAVLGALGVAALGVVFLYVVRMREQAAEATPVAMSTTPVAAQELAPVQLEPPPAPVATASAQIPEASLPAISAAPPPMSPVAEPPASEPPQAPSFAATAPEPARPEPRPLANSPPPRPLVKPEASPVARRAAVAAASKPESAAIVAVKAVPVAAGEEAGTVTAQAVASSRPKIRQGEANRLIGNFSRAYEQGDLQQMRELFAADARGQSGNLQEILQDYGRVFESSSERSLLVRDVNWFEDGENITIVAGYEASVTSRGGKARRTRGDLRLDLRRESDRWRIYRVRHDERRG